MKTPSDAELRQMLEEQRGQGVLAAQRALKVSAPLAARLPARLPARLAARSPAPLAGAEDNPMGITLKDVAIIGSVAAVLIFLTRKSA